MKRLKQIFSIIHRHDPSILPVCLLAALLQGLMPFVSLLFSARILDELLLQNFMPAVYLTAAMLLLLFFGGLLQDFLQMKVSCYINEFYYLSDLWMHEHALTLDYASISTYKTLESLRMAQEALRQRGGLGNVLDMLTRLISHLFTIVTSFGLVLYLCLQPPAHGPFAILSSGPVSLLLALTVLTGLILSNFYFRKKDQQIRTQHLEASFRSDIIFHYLNRAVVANPQAFKTIELGRMAPMLYQRFCQDQTEACETFLLTFPQDKKMNRLDSLFSALVMLLAYGLTVLKILSGAISVGGLLQYTGAVSQFSTGFLQLTATYQDLMIYLSSISYVLDFYELENQFETGHIPVEKRTDHVYELEFHDVSFAYPGTEKQILKHVSCKLNLKQKMAVVGPNGAGKTTFIKLLCRLYEPTSGCITLNGIDIRKYDYRQYLDLFGIVFQDFALFPYSIAENIASSQTPDEARIWQALRLVEMEDRVRRLPQGLDTPLFSHSSKEGVNFSGGELQKLAIARALYKDAPLVILDEPTAALDPISEYEIYSHFDTLVQDKTSIFISHRMSSCRFCEDILVFEDGRLAERGSHSALLAQDGSLYASMWNAQAQYYELNSEE
ncbi:MAG: ABC transporter ATP-binding protein [Lachnospiraceae bacterium]|jgi:ATP-binding cassette subfamily B protein|nr:ABC transporter ATP-binding protein [Lachnospiraceae bacterium]